MFKQSHETGNTLKKKTTRKSKNHNGGCDDVFLVSRELVTWLFKDQVNPIIRDF